MMLDVGYPIDYVKNFKIIVSGITFPKRILPLFALFVIVGILFFISSLDCIALGSSASYVNNDTLASSANKKVALVLPSFTWAAYQNDSFYNFYSLYSYIQFANREVNISITNNTYLLQDRPIPQGPFVYYSDLEEEPYIPYINYINLAKDLYRNHGINPVNITDGDVDQGKIFNPDGTNAYDILFLFHNEYVTQAEYDNLKKFVTNGGTIVFGDGNVLYAEVKYHKNNNTISLVRGHNWNFDQNRTAWKGPAERWLDETREWVGSNFLDIPANYPLRFNNNPFNYTHSEENYVANPNAKILIDYGLTGVPRYSGQYLGAIVATYEMDYGKGRIIHMGLWGHMLAQNNEFVNFLNNEIIPLSLNGTLK
ncbi:MAG TPA: N,N-dimethylformamidase beta subunit family domain-containing protein [Candidatus Nitrosocosmicus sp.]|nr:N,N-dimethylformamidase beta subunit family domain-containing protein [Candidatus Nitrosocosmicus sp.]